jgi:pilus assembly protein Flp/PilA
MARAGCLDRGIPVAMGSVASRGKVPRFINQVRHRRNVIAKRRCNSSGEDLMSMLINYVKSFARNDEGQDLLEYALLVALIALVAILAVTQAGEVVSGIFADIAGQLGGAA